MDQFDQRPMGLRDHNIYSQLSLQEIFKKLTETPDRSLYNYFFNKYYPKLVWFALLFVKQHSAAEEVVSDVMFNIFKKRAKLAEMNNIEGYIFISVKNQSLKYLKKRKRQVFIEHKESETDLLMTTTISPEHEFLQDEFHNVVRSTIDALPQKRKLVFKLIKEDGLKYNDAAKLLDLSVKTIETHMGLALKSLREQIDQYKNEQSREVRIISIKK